ncbi:hypothetical protein V2H77_12380 [Photorhabdus sp. P32]
MPSRCILKSIGYSVDAPMLMAVIVQPTNKPYTPQHSGFAVPVPIEVRVTVLEVADSRVLPG